MIVALLISADTSLATRLRDAAGQRAFVVQAPSIEAAARLRSSAPDAVLYDMGSSLHEIPWDQVRPLTAGCAVIVISTRRDPLAEAAWLRSGARAVYHPEDMNQLAQAFDALSMLPFTSQSSAAIPSNATELRRVAHSPAPAWESALRCLSRSWQPGAEPMAVARLGVELCREGLGAARTAVLLTDGRGGLTLAAGENLTEDARLAYRPEHGAPLAALLESVPRLLRPDQGQPATARIVSLLGAEVCVPLMSAEGIEGVLLAASPASGGTYGPEHEELLLLLGRLLGRTLAEARGNTRMRDAQLNYDAALNDAPAGLLCLDERLHVEAMNREAENLLGITRAEAAGKHVQMLHSELCDAAMSAQDGTAGEAPFLVRRPKLGGSIEARLTVRPDGRMVFALVSLPEARVDRDKDAAAALWESIALRMAQEIKNPLVAINTFAQLLPRKYESEDFRAAFGKVVQEEIERINGVVDTLYQFAAEPELKLQQLDVNTTVREVVDAFARSVAERGIKVESRIGETPLSAAIDPEAFRTVMQHLMRNAAEAMPSGGKVSVSAEQSPRGIEIRVEDSGAGIAREHTGRVFDPFYSSKERGAGLGLTIARKLTEAQEGSLELESPAEGTRFLLRFPNLAAAAGRASISHTHADDPHN